mmetsp:Transcript_10734/g.25605  ORF Transcript_10734/g.25605 Transcript_10734/m.25605 type:complete len:465 (-) Transcript_10734:110-1504(-)
MKQISIFLSFLATGDAMAFRGHYGWRLEQWSACECTHAQKRGIQSRGVECPGSAVACGPPPPTTRKCDCKASLRAGRTAQSMGLVALELDSTVVRESAAEFEAQAEDAIDGDAAEDSMAEDEEEFDEAVTTSLPSGAGVELPVGSELYSSGGTMEVAEDIGGDGMPGDRVSDAVEDIALLQSSGGGRRDLAEPTQKDLQSLDSSQMLYMSLDATRTAVVSAVRVVPRWFWIVAGAGVIVLVAGVFLCSGRPSRPGSAREQRIVSARTRRKVERMTIAGLMGPQGSIAAGGIIIVFALWVVYAATSFGRHSLACTQTARMMVIGLLPIAYTALIEALTAANPDKVKDHVNVYRSFLGVGAVCNCGVSFALLVLVQRCHLNVLSATAVTEMLLLFAAAAASLALAVSVSPSEVEHKQTVGAFPRPANDHRAPKAAPVPMRLPGAVRGVNGEDLMPAFVRPTQVPKS